MNYRLLQGDCLDTLRTLDDNSVDSIVTDPPYGLSDHRPGDVENCLRAWMAGDPYMTKRKGFMSKTWDSWVPGPEVWRECFRVLKPGGYILVFASTRTDDLMSMALRLAGFRKHPFLAWVFGSGFPKATNLSKQIDKAAGAEREVVGFDAAKAAQQTAKAGTDSYGDFAGNSGAITAPATDAARQWDGWFYGLQALKPAMEPIQMFQKPHQGRMVDNIAQYGTGALNIDGCRVATRGEQPKGSGRKPLSYAGQNHRPYHDREPAPENVTPAAGRWPANVIHDGSPEVVEQFPANAAGKGSAARFFYCAKASKKDRNEGCEGLQSAHTDRQNKLHGAIQYRNICLACGRILKNSVTECCGATPERIPSERQKRANNHPTVKPCSLMVYLCRLVTPPGGVVLDPFMGSGSTGKAALREGFQFIGIEREAEYIAIAEQRLAGAQHATPSPEREPEFDVNHAEVTA